MKNLTSSRIISSDISPTKWAVRVSRVMLPQKFLLLLLVFGCSLVPAGNSFGQANQKAKQTANQAKRQQEQRAMLTQKYGMNMAQIQQYEALQKVCTDKIAAIKQTSGLTPKERKHKINACHKEFLASVDQILSPQQLSVMKDKEEATKRNWAAVQPILKSYHKERSTIQRNKDATPSARAEAFAQLDKKYESRLTAVVGEDQAQRVLKRQALNRNANTKDVKKYKLSYADAQTYDKLGEANKQSQEKLDNTTLTHKDRTKKSKQIKDEQEANVKDLFGDNKFQLWHRDHNPTVDQSLKRKYGFSDQQLKQYDDLLNSQAIAILKIRRGKGTQAEKQARIAQVRADTEQKLQQILTPAQYSKMVANKQKVKNGERHKTIEAHTVKPAPKAGTAAANAKP